MEKLNIFAAGNLFTGTFDCGTGFLDTFGFARFGVKYDFAGRPRALRLRYNATISNVTHKGKSNLTTNDIDSARMFVCVVDWTGRHAVKSGASYDESTFWDPDNQSSVSEGQIIGYSSVKLGKSSDGWQTMTLPLRWYDRTAAPTAGNYSLVISCATSYKGDYVAGLYQQCPLCGRFRMGLLISPVLPQTRLPAARRGGFCYIRPACKEPFRHFYTRLRSSPFYS